MRSPNSVDKRSWQLAMAVTPDDPNYVEQAKIEAEFWNHCGLTVQVLNDNKTEQVQQFVNLGETGNRETWWLDDLIARGPYGEAAILGSTEGTCEAYWLRAGASRHLTVYELSPGVIKRARAQLRVRRFGLRWPDPRARFIQTDLNFVQLPRNRYDVVWASGCIHHLINLEHIFAQVAMSLRPGGLFAFQDYVGEPRLDYDAERLRTANEVFREIPPRFRIGGIEALAQPPREMRSPFEAARSDEILTTAQATFDTAHIGRTSALFPLFLHVDFHALAREAPALVTRLLRAEEEAQRRPGARLCFAYGVFRKRALGHSV